MEGHICGPRTDDIKIIVPKGFSASEASHDSRGRGQIGSDVRMLWRATVRGSTSGTPGASSSVLPPTSWGRACLVGLAACDKLFGRTRRGGKFASGLPEKPLGIRCWEEAHWVAEFTQVTTHQLLASFAQMQERVSCSVRVVSWNVVF